MFFQTGRNTFTFVTYTMQGKYCNHEKLNLEIFTYLYVLRPPEFIYAILTVTYACIYVCACVRVCMSLNDSI